MDMAQLNYFIVTVEENNTIRASERLHITQPALSKSIARLEKELGTALFQRSGRRNELTREGKLFYNWAKNTIESFSSIHQQLSSASNNKLNIAISSYNATNSLINAFALDYPYIRINERTFWRSDFPRIIFNSDIDCVLSAQNYEGEGITSMLVMHSPLYLACASDHPFAKRKCVSLKEAQDENFVFPLRNTMFYDILISIFGKAGFLPNIRVEASRTHIRELVKNGIGVSVVSTPSFGADTSDISVVRLEDDFCFRDTFLIWSSNGTPSSALSSFIDFTSEYSESQRTSQSKHE